MHNISVVNLIPDQYKEKINTLAEVLHTGPNSMSVKLTDISGGIWWGCHAWWLPEDLAYFKDPESSLSEGIDLSLYEEALQYLKWYVVDTEYGGSHIAIENWNMALEQEGLSIFNEEIV